MPVWGGIEAGGTKFVCVVGTSPEDLRVELRIPTTTPTETIARVIEFFQQQQKQIGTLDAIGIGSFGPVDPNPNSPTFGYLMNTPKPGWQNLDLVGIISQTLGVPVAFDTDVNAAALGEYCWGAAQGLDTFLYLTVGTGIGGGAMIDGRLLHGLLHPEMGHISIPHDLDIDPFRGCCPFHGDCLEGLASGPAIEKRWGQKADLLPADHPAWSLEAHYLALGLVNWIFTLCPQRIIMGGGVMQQKHLFPLVRFQVREMLKRYLAVPTVLEQIEDYILPPMLGDRAGIAGAIALAQGRAG
ncbi:ROK family protein [Scytonema sp. NUACC21]